MYIPVLELFYFYFSGYGKKKRDTGYHSFHEPECNELCGTVEDCFDQPCPRYGYVVKYTFTRGGDGNSPVAPLAWVPWVPGNPSIFEQWVPETINFGQIGLNLPLVK